MGWARWGWPGGGRWAGLGRGRAGKGVLGRDGSGGRLCWEGPDWAVQGVLGRAGRGRAVQGGVAQGEVGCGWEVLSGAGSNPCSDFERES